MICLSDDTGFFLRFTVVLNGYPCAACMVSSEIPLDTMQRARQRGKGMLKKSKRFTAAVLAAFLLAGLLPTGIRIQAQETLSGQGDLKKSVRNTVLPYATRRRARCF